MSALVNLIKQRLLFCRGHTCRESISVTDLAVHKPLHCESRSNANVARGSHRWRINAQPIPALANMTEGINQGEVPRMAAPSVMLRPGIDHSTVLFGEAPPYSFSFPFSN